MGSSIQQLSGNTREYGCSFAGVIFTASSTCDTDTNILNAAVTQYSAGQFACQPPTTGFTTAGTTVATSTATFTADLLDIQLASLGCSVFADEVLLSVSTAADCEAHARAVDAMLQVCSEAGGPPATASRLSCLGGPAVEFEALVAPSATSCNQVADGLNQLVARHDGGQPGKFGCSFDGSGSLISSETPPTTILGPGRRRKGAVARCVGRLQVRNGICAGVATEFTCERKGVSVFAPDGLCLWIEGDPDPTTPQVSTAPADTRAAPPGSRAAPQVLCSASVTRLSDSIQSYLDGAFTCIPPTEPPSTSSATGAPARTTTAALPTQTPLTRAVVNLLAEFNTGVACFTAETGGALVTRAPAIDTGSSFTVDLAFSARSAGYLVARSSPDGQRFFGLYMRSRGRGIYFYYTSSHDPTQQRKVSWGGLDVTDNNFHTLAFDVVGARDGTTTVVSLTVDGVVAGHRRLVGPILDCGEPSNRCITHLGQRQGGFATVGCIFSANYRYRNND